MRAATWARLHFNDLQSFHPFSRRATQGDDLGPKRASDATVIIDGTINHSDVDSNPPIDSDFFGADFLASIAIRAFLLPWHFEPLEPEDFNY